MYGENKIGKVKSDITRVPTETGESIEEMIRRCTESNEPIEASAPMIYTEEENGVMPQYDIRADRFDIALDAIDKYQASEVAKGKNTSEEKKTDASASDGDENKTE